MKPPCDALTLAQKVGAIMLLILLAVAIVVPLLGFDQPNLQQLSQSFAPSSAQWPLGTDQFGRDMLARLATAIKLSFGLSLLCVLTSAALGVAFGVMAAWGGSRLDSLLSFLANTVMALPGLVLILLIASLQPGSFALLYLAISLTLWVEYFRVVRASVQPLVGSHELQASAMLGFSRWYCFRRHIWPVIAPDVFTLAAFGAATAILMMASVGFVYAGLKPPTAELGLMIVELFPYFSAAPWVLIQPLLVLSLMVLGFHLLAGKKS